MDKAELESKHLAELHALAADAGVERYRMLPRAELIERLAAGPTTGQPSGGPGKASPSEAPRKAPRSEASRKESPEGGRPERAEATAAAPERPKRRRRRRRWGRRRKEVRIQDLLLPPVAGRQALVYADSREACTALLREVAAELSSATRGPDPIALLVDPSPEELADWKRDAPRAEIVAAGKAQHAADAVAQARARAGAGEDVIVLVDSLSRFAEAFGSADATSELFDAGRDAGDGNGTLTVVAALERAD